MLVTPAVFFSAESREDLLFLEEQSLWMHLISFCLKQQLERVLFFLLFIIYLFFYISPSGLNQKLMFSNVLCCAPLNWHEWINERQLLLCLLQDEPPLSAARQASVAVSGEAGGSAGDFYQAHLHKEAGPQRGTLRPDATPPAWPVAMSPSYCCNWHVEITQ